MKRLIPIASQIPISEFPLVKEVWYHYPQQEPNPDEDHIFGTFVDGTPGRGRKMQASPGRARSRRGLHP